MKKFLKKTIVFAIAAIMMLAMAIPAMAADFTADRQAVKSDTGKITVTDIQEGATAYAIQIVEADYDGTDDDSPWLGTYSLTEAAENAIKAIDARQKAAAKEKAEGEGKTQEEIDAAVAEAAFTYDMQNPTSDAIAKLAAEMNNNLTDADKMAPNATTKTTYEKNVAAGQYIILVQGTNSVIYNPMVVSKVYDKDKQSTSTQWASAGDSNGGSVSANESFTEGDTAKAKKTTIEADKKQLGSYYLKPDDAGTLNKDGATWKEGDGAKYTKVEYPCVVVGDPDTNLGQGGDDVQIGDMIKFQLKTQVPNYNTAIYEKPHFSISDTLEENKFDAAKNIVVYVAEKDDAAGAQKKVVDPSNYSITETTKSGDDYPAWGGKSNSFRILFTPDWIVNNLEKHVFVEYEAKLTATAGVNFDANNNQMTVSYSNNPNEDFSNQPKEGDEDLKDYTIDYTFEVNLLKTDDQTARNTLKGAQFTLYRTEDDAKAGTNPVQVSSETGTNGKFKFTGLNGDQTYYMVETKAPEGGYQINKTIYQVKVTPKYKNESATSTWYEPGQKYTIDNVEYEAKVRTKVTAHTFELESYTVSVTGNGSEMIKTDAFTAATHTADAARILNTKMNELPSTGGMGTYIFTIIGVAVVAIAAGMLIFRRKQA